MIVRALIRRSNSWQNQWSAVTVAFSLRSRQPKRTTRQLYRHLARSSSFAFSSKPQIEIGRRPSARWAGSRSHFRLFMERDSSGLSVTQIWQEGVLRADENRVTPANAYFSRFLAMCALRGGGRDFVARGLCLSFISGGFNSLSARDCSYSLLERQT